MQPPRWAFVSIAAVETPFHSTAMIYWDGKFKFKNLEQGIYTIAVYVPRMGEFRRTYSLGPGTADDKGRVKVTVFLNPQRASRLLTAKDRFTVPIARISIPEKAWKEYGEAQKKLKKNDMEGARQHLEKAVEIAPRFSAAWNHLGTIAYQTKNFELAERNFREALKFDPESFEPVVNLAGALLSLGKQQEALKYNQDAVRMRPKDALANSQLGLSYFAAGDLDLAERHLQEAKRLDPGHFSSPQITLFEIQLRRGNRQAAAAELEHFLRYHPDHPQAAKMRETAKKLRAATP